MGGVRPCFANIWFQHQSFIYLTQWLLQIEKLRAHTTILWRLQVRPLQFFLKFICIVSVIYLLASQLLHMLDNSQIPTCFPELSSTDMCSPGNTDEYEVRR
jgi:hypothetical protein